MSAAQVQQLQLLHLGCGLTTPDEWINVDGSMNARMAKYPALRSFLSLIRVLPKSQARVNWSKNVRYVELRKPLPFKDRSMDAVYSSHTIEHLYRDEALAMLRESLRVLKPGCNCRGLVPDLRALIDEYLGQRSLPEYLGSYDATVLNADAARRLNHRMLFRLESPTGGSLLYRLYQAFQDHHLHKWLYDGDSLAKLFVEAGFTDVRIRGFLDTDIPFLNKVELPGRFLEGMGVAVEGSRPA